MRIMKTTMSLCKKITIFPVSFLLLFLPFAGADLQRPPSFSIVEISAIVQHNNQIYVQWIVEGQSGAGLYEIDRSADGFNFIKVGEVPFVIRKDTLQETLKKTYDWTDTTLPTSSAYYRVKGIENNGETGYSKDVQVSYGNNDNDAV